MSWGDSPSPSAAIATDQPLSAVALQVLQWVFAAAPGHPALQEICDHIAANALTRFSNNTNRDTLERTGPGVWTDVVLKHATLHPPAAVRQLGGDRHLPSQPASSRASRQHLMLQHLADMWAWAWAPVEGRSLLVRCRAVRNRRNGPRAKRFALPGCVLTHQSLTRLPRPMCVGRRGPVAGAHPAEDLLGRAPGGAGRHGAHRAARRRAAPLPRQLEGWSLILHHAIHCPVHPSTPSLHFHAECSRDA